MATILKEQLNCAGWDVLLMVAGRPVTLSFQAQPSAEALAEAIRVYEESQLRAVSVGGEERDVLDR